MLPFKHTQKHTVDALFILMLLTLFTAGAILIISIGARQYRSITDRMSVNYEMRTLSAYLTEKLNQNDTEGSVLITDVAGNPAVALTEIVRGQEYTTCIYAFDGYLWEILICGDTPFAPEDGQKIIEVKNFEAQAVSDTLYAFTFTGSTDNSDTLYISLNSMQ